jgi:hypothetical protein
MPFVRFPIALATLLLAARPLVPTSVAQSPAAPLALTGATIYPSPDLPAIRNGVILLRDGRIAAVGRHGEVTVPRGTDTLDCTGLTVTAGFWNSHVHFGERKWERAAELPAAEASEQLRQMLTGHGFTRVFDTGSPLRNTLALRRRIAAGEVAGPAILTTGGIIWPKGGVPSLPVMAALGFIIEPQEEVATPDEAAARARKRLDAGADGVKVYAATIVIQRRWPGVGARRRRRRGGAHRAGHGDLERLPGAADGEGRRGADPHAQALALRGEERQAGVLPPVRAGGRGSAPRVPSRGRHGWWPPRDRPAAGGAEGGLDRCPAGEGELPEAVVHMGEIRAQHETGVRVGAEERQEGGAASPVGRKRRVALPSLARRWPRPCRHRHGRRSGPRASPRARTRLVAPSCTRARMPDSVRKKTCS